MLQVNHRCPTRVASSNRRVQILSPFLSSFSVCLSFPLLRFPFPSPSCTRFLFVFVHVFASRRSVAAGANDAPLGAVWPPSVFARPSPPLSHVFRLSPPARAVRSGAASSRRAGSITRPQRLSLLIRSITHAHTRSTASLITASLCSHRSSSPPLPHPSHLRPRHVFTSSSLSALSFPSASTRPPRPAVGTHSQRCSTVGACTTYRNYHTKTKKQKFEFCSKFLRDRAATCKLIKQS